MAAVVIADFGGDLGPTGDYGGGPPPAPSRVETEDPGPIPTRDAAASAVVVPWAAPDTLGVRAGGAVRGPIVRDRAGFGVTGRFDAWRSARTSAVSAAVAAQARAVVTGTSYATARVRVDPAVLTTDGADLRFGGVAADASWTLFRSRDEAFVVSAAARSGVVADDPRARAGGRAALTWRPGDHALDLAVGVEGFRWADGAALDSFVRASDTWALTDTVAVAPRAHLDVIGVDPWVSPGVTLRWAPSRWAEVGADAGRRLDVDALAVGARAPDGRPPSTLSATIWATHALWQVWWVRLEGGLTEATTAVAPPADAARRDTIAGATWVTRQAAHAELSAIFPASSQWAVDARVRVTPIGAGGEGALADPLAPWAPTWLDTYRPVAVSGRASWQSPRWWSTGVAAELAWGSAIRAEGGWWLADRARAGLTVTQDLPIRGAPLAVALGGQAARRDPAASWWPVAAQVVGQPDAAAGAWWRVFAAVGLSAR